MDTIEIKKANAWAAYDKASPKIKAVLEDLLGKEVFSRNIMDRVKTFEDAFALVEDELDSAAKTVLGYNGSDPFMLNIKHDVMVKIVCMALNEGWEPNWNDSNETKYYPWFKFNAGSGLSYFVYVIVHSSTIVGSRLVYKTLELAKYAGNQFADLYSKSYLIKK
jgi:hypothetical protein